MAYPVQLLTTQADCDAVLAAMQAEQHELEVRESVLDLRDDKTTTAAADRAAELLSLQTTIPQLQTLIPTLPAGSKIRRTNETMLRQYLHRQDDLQAASPTQGPVAALLQALDLRQLQVQVAEIQQAIQEVTARKAVV
jgi:hypothetical protein